MHLTRTDILGQEHHNLPLARNLGDAFAVVCRFFGPTPNPVMRALSLDKKVAENALAGRAGVPAITKALQARQKNHDDHYELWDALGEMIFGEPRDAYDERKLRRIIEANTHAIDTLASRRKRRAELRSFAPADDSRLDRRRA